MKFSALTERVRGEGADAWLTHYDAVAARERGEDVIILSIGDPDLETPAPVMTVTRGWPRSRRASSRIPLSRESALMALR